jgi:acetyl-CoA carboxylase beta subunit
VLYLYYGGFAGMNIVRLEQFGTWHIDDNGNTLCNINTGEANKKIKASNDVWNNLDLKCDKCNAIHYDFEIKSSDITTLKELTRETIQVDTHLDRLYKKKLRKKYKCNDDPMQYIKDKRSLEMTMGSFDTAIADMMKDPYKNDPSVYM